MSPLVTHYRPPRPSIWRDLRSVPFALSGVPMLLPFVAVGVLMKVF